MAYHNDSKEQLEFFKEKYENIVSGTDEYERDLDFRLGSLLGMQSKIIKEMNEILESKAKYRWCYWWEMILIKYVMRKFKIKKSIAHSPKAQKFYSYALKNKHYKQKPDTIKDMNKEMVIAYLSEIKKDSAIESYYNIIIHDLIKNNKNLDNN